MRPLRMVIFIEQNQQDMKKLWVNITLFAVVVLSFASCKKKEDGVCYCHYLSGDKKEYDLSALTRSEQIDSCYVLDGLAEAFAGDCDLK